MRIAYSNYIDTASTVTALTESPAYPASNVQDQRLTTVFRSTAVTSQTVTINLGSARSVDTIAILAHNITSSATITVAANTSDSWPGATSQTVTWNAGTMLKFFTAASYQYWQFQISDATNTDGYLQIGRLYLGNYIDIDPSSLLNFKVTKARTDNVIHGPNRQKFASIGYSWRRFELDFPRSNTTMINKILTMYDTIGQHTSCIFCNFDTIRDYTIVEPCYVSIANDITFTHEENMNFTYSLTLEEEK